MSHRFVLPTLVAALLAAGCGGEDCEAQSQSIAGVDACLMPDFAPGASLEVAILTDWKAAGCPTPSCTVRVEGGDLFFTLERNACEPEETAACPESRQVAARCDVPPLVPGQYTVRVNGQARFGFLRVVDGSSETSCAF